MFSNTPPFKHNPTHSNSSIKNVKNIPSQEFVFDAQRLHRIRLRTIELLNQYFQKIDVKATMPQHQNTKKPPKSNFQLLRDRYFSLSSDNQQLIAKHMKQMKLTYKDVFRSEQLKQMQQKLKRVKTTSNTLDKQIKLYEQHLVDQLRNLNLQGNDWFQMKFNTKIKQQWRKRNQNQVQGYKLDNSNVFFHRKITTDYEAEKQRIISNIKKLRLQTDQQRTSKSLNNHQEIMFSIGQQLNQNQPQKYEDKNKFVQRAWKPPKTRTLSQQSAHSNQRKGNLFRSHNKNMKHLNSRQELKFTGSNQFQGQYQPLTNFISQQKRLKQPKVRKSDKLKIERSKTDMKIQRKWSQNTKQNNNNDLGLQFPSGYQRSPFKSSFHAQKTKEMNLRLQKDKTTIQQNKQSIKLVL